VELLPTYETVNLKPLHPNYLKSEILLTLIWILILLIIQIVIFIILGGWAKQKIFLFIAIPVFTLIGILPLIVVYLGFYNKAYALRQRDILYKTGLLWRKTIVLPFNRIQHSEVNHGPIDRMYGLASLKLFTAGGSTSDLSIPGLNDEEAHRLKEFITRKTGMDEEE
jgi:membrane protein YdbS with pleckstrin-like domain